ncbi:MAG TPA: hypothetical protein PKC24_07300 [Cyclobacteriaceae bacterium]|nr:hypothetical protein [Cyclobacteriaceae bacterium]
MYKTLSLLTLIAFSQAKLFAQEMEPLRVQRYEYKKVYREINGKKIACSEMFADTSITLTYAVNTKPGIHDRKIFVNDESFHLRLNKKGNDTLRSAEGEFLALVHYQEGKRFSIILPDERYFFFQRLTAKEWKYKHGTATVMHGKLKRENGKNIHEIEIFDIQTDSIPLLLMVAQVPIAELMYRRQRAPVVIAGICFSAFITAFAPQRGPTIGL